MITVVSSVGVAHASRLRTSPSARRRDACATPRLFASVFVALSIGCAQNVNVKVTSPHTKVVVDGHDLGEVPTSGEFIEVRPGMEPLTYVIKNGNEAERVGTVARSEPVWWLVALGAGGAVCCAPALAGAGFCIANPAVIGAPLAFALSGDVGALTASFVAPSWFTLPLVTGCTALGMAPLGAALAAETVPPELTLPPRPPVASAQSTAMAH